MARALLKQRRMPVEFWGEVVVTAVYLQNRLLTKSLSSRTPYEAWHGRKPEVNHLCVFGCRAFVKQLDHVDKLTDQSHTGVFIGYAKGAKAYRILDPAARQVCTARDIVFDEAHGCDWIATTGASPAQISMSNTSTSGHLERQRRLDRHRRMPRVHQHQVSGHQLHRPQHQSSRQVHSQE
jgi:hypothetical protein